MAFLLLAFSGVPTLSLAIGAPVIFADGFESGDICAWQGSCSAPSDVSGVWVGSLDFAGSERAFVVQLHQRLDGRLIGYILGGTHRRTVLDGTYSAGTLNIELEISDPSGIRSVEVAGTVSGAMFTAVASGDITTQPVTFHRWAPVLHERRFGFLDPGLGGDYLQELAVVLEEDGTFIGGGFSPPHSCRLWACNGGVVSFDESGSALTIGLETDGGCSEGSQLEALFDPGSSFYSGTYTFTNCSGTETGDLIGARTTRTRSDHVAQVLSILGGIADQFEAGVPFMAPHPAFATDYLHEGKNLATLFAEWNAELASFTGIEAEFHRVKLISTVDDPFAFEAFEVPLGVLLDRVRTGTSIDEGAPETYLDSTGDLLFNVARNPLRVLEEDSGTWRIAGNRQPAFDLPWVYTIDTDGRLLTATNGAPIHVSHGVYGAHSLPHTGHFYGDHKGDFVGFLPADISEMDELLGDGVGNEDGVCDAGEDCGYWGELDGSGVRDRIPVYRAVQDGRVTEVLFVNGPTGVYFDDVPQWRVKVRFDSGVDNDLDHVGAFVPALAAQIEVISGCNPNTWETCGLADGTELLEGSSIPVAAGDPLCYPQTMATEILPSHPGYYVGNGGWLNFPWVQMEFTNNSVVDSAEFNVCTYRLLASAKEDALQAAMDIDMLDPDSQRYASGFTYPLWLWRAEGRACMNPAEIPRGFGALYSQLGAWFERPSGGTTQDEIFAYAPIAKDTAVYDPLLYDPMDPDAFVRRQRALGAPDFVWMMPGGGDVSPVRPAGELLELTADVMLIKWREIGFSGSVYQRAAYRLDEDGLTIKWGVFGATAPDAIAPILGLAEPCDDLTVICYDHEPVPGF
jgi:hypothetical protein